MFSATGAAWSLCLWRAKTRSWRAIGDARAKIAWLVAEVQGGAAFRRQDRADADMIAALRWGAAGVLEVVRELDRLTAVLSQKALAGDMTGDGVRFHAAFRRFYEAR